MKWQHVVMRRNDTNDETVVGYPVAMGNGSKEVKDVAKYVTATMMIQGVAKGYLSYYRNE